MTIPELVAITLGFLIEVVWLLHRTDLVTNYLPDLIRPSWPTWLQDLYSEYQIWLWALPLLTFAFLYGLLPSGEKYLGWLDPVFTALSVAMLLIVLYYGLIGHEMMPKVNMQKMFVVHLIVMLTLLMDGAGQWPAWALWLLLIPTVALLIQAFWPRQLKLTTITIYYFWYLLTLLLLTRQNLGEDFFTETSLNSFELFIIACTFVFLSLHALLALRFLIIVTSMIRPHNRLLLPLLVPNLVQEERMPRSRVILFILFAVATLGANQIADLASTLAVSNLIVLAIVQYDNNKSTNLLAESS